MNNKDAFFNSLPEDWGFAKIGEMFEITKKPKEIVYASYDLIPFIAMDLVPVDSLYLNKFEFKKPSEISSGTYIETGALLLAKITPCFENGKQCVVQGLPNGFGVASTEIIPIKEKTRISSKYFLFYYLLKSDVRKMIAGKMEGATGRQRVPIQIIKELLIPFPSLSEQQKIAAVLFKIQKAIEIQEAIIEKMRELKRSTLHHVFTHGLRGEKLKETEIGPIPGNWNLVRIKDIVSETSQVDPSRTPEQKIKYIDVSSVSNTRYVIETWINVLGKQAPSRARKVLKEGDVIVATVRPTLRRLAFITSDFDNGICSTAFCVLRPRNDVLDPKFLFYSIQRDEFFTGLEKLQQGASYPAVTDSDIKDQRIPLAPLEEQKEIAHVFQTIDQKIELHTAKKSAIHDLFKTMLNKLMTGEIRVKDLDIDTSEVSS